jgi:hypothetical protein
MVAYSTNFLYSLVTSILIYIFSSHSTLIIDLDRRGSRESKAAIYHDIRTGHVTGRIRCAEEVNLVGNQVSGWYTREGLVVHLRP